MRRSRRATTLPALLAMLAVVPTVERVDAQTRTVPVRASATILAHLEADAPTDLDFGAVWVTEAPVTEVRRMGSFAFTHNSDVRVTVPALPTELTGPDGHTVPVRFLCTLSREPDGAAAPVPCDALGQVAVDSPGTVQRTFVRISGSIPEGTPVHRTGRYDARLEFVLEAIY